MPFTLRIQFSGLCLFVPKRDTAGLMRMHVLMPNVSVGHHCGDRHIPVLKFDTAHLRTNQRKEDEIVAYRKINGKSLGIAIGSTEASDRICPQIVKLRDVTQRDVPEALLAQFPGTGRLGARVTLGAGAMTRVARGKCWEWEAGQAQRMAHAALWEIPMTTDDLSLTLDLLGGGIAQELPVLYPIGGDTEVKVINLSVHHLTPDDLAPIAPPVVVPGNGEPAHHFTAYYDLYGSQTAIRLPRYAGDACVLPADPCLDDVDMGSSAFNCMLGSGG